MIAIGRLIVYLDVWANNTLDFKRVGKIARKKIKEWDIEFRREQQ
jgi:hypothetical protein